MRVAAIDIGTNSVLLLVAEMGPEGALVPVVERAQVTRLGQGVDASGALADAAVERTLSCLQNYAEEARNLGVSALDAVGTSAMRDAQGGPELRARAKALLGVEPRVISGDEEAALTFEGALLGLGKRAPFDAQGSVLVFDVGGGSTEIIVGKANEIVAKRSLDIGSVRLTERHLHSDPPLLSELEALRADVARALRDAPKVPDDATIVGVAGTVTTIAALCLELVEYDAARVHGAWLSTQNVCLQRERLARLTLAERRKLPGLEPKRADVIVGGAALVEELLRTWKGQSPSSGMVVSDRGVRWGLARRMWAAAAPVC